VRAAVVALALLVALALAGCSAPVNPGHEQAPLRTVEVDHRKAHWTLSDDFTTEEIDTITSAAMAWRDATEGGAELTFEIAPVETWAPWTISRVAGEKPGYGAITGPERDRIAIYPDAVPEGCLRLVAEHEIGHTLWIDHGGAGIMQASHSKKTCVSEGTITADDVGLFAAANP
jgi:hypothetical protein